MKKRVLCIPVITMMTTLCISMPVFSEENTTSYEIQGYEFQIPTEWVTLKSISSISCAIIDEHTNAIVNLEADEYVGDNFQAQYQFFNDAINYFGEGSESFERDEISRYEAGEFTYLIGEFSCDSMEYMIAFLPDKVSNSSVIVMMQDNSKGDNLSVDFFQLLGSVKAVEEKIPQTEVWNSEQSTEETVANQESTDPSSFTTSQKNAIKEAESYLSYTSFSRKGLIEQLSSEYGSGFDVEDAEFAVAYLEANGQVDWDEQAVKEAESYLEFTSFSRNGLYDQLTSEYGSQFTPEQAEYALQQVYDQ